MEQVRAFAPGRTEIAGNHVDHQGGRVIAATLDCGIEVVAQRNDDNRARLESEGFEPVDIDVTDGVPRDAEHGTTAAFVRGVACCLASAGLPVGGFDAQVRSSIPSGGGLSSSAAFTLALASAVQELYPGDAALSADEMAKMAAQVERVYFGKPCGLMDQMAIAHGGVVSIDFGEGLGVPAISSIDFDFADHDMALCLIDTHCDHTRYLTDYARVADDMAAVAQFLGLALLSEGSESMLMRRYEDVRRALGDLPALRALHFYHEMELVGMRESALRAGDIAAFIDATRRSGASSAQYLQNVSTADREHQPAMVALALADILVGSRGACRIHGGGFGGTVQVFIPISMVSAFTTVIDSHLGARSCRRYRISRRGVHTEWL